MRRNPFIQLFALMLAAALFLTSAPAAMAEEIPQMLVLEDGTAAFFRGDPDALTCGIPAEYEGHPVTAVYENAFRYCGKLESVVIPEGVTSVGRNAFAYCQSLTGVVLPESVTSIGIGAFFGCVSLESITLPGHLAEIGEGAFICCPALKEITIPGSVREVGEFVFSGDLSRVSRFASSVVAGNGDMIMTIPPYMQGTGLMRAVLREGVETIGPRAFCDCENLTEVVIPASVTSIGEDAFRGCISLTNVFVTSGSYAEQYCIDNGLPYTTTDP